MHRWRVRSCSAIQSIAARSSRASWNSAGFGRTKFAAVIRGGSPEGQCGLPHAPDVRIDEVQRSLYWFVVFVLCNLANLACHRL